MNAPSQRGLFVYFTPCTHVPTREAKPSLSIASSQSLYLNPKYVQQQHRTSAPYCILPQDHRGTGLLTAICPKNHTGVLLYLGLILQHSFMIDTASCTNRPSSLRPNTPQINPSNCAWTTDLPWEKSNSKLWRTSCLGLTFTRQGLRGVNHPRRFTKLGAARDGVRS